MLNVKHQVITITIDQHKLILHETFSTPLPIAIVGRASSGR
jgi:hypothetical protein